MLDTLLLGLELVLRVEILAFLVGGTLVGYFVGALPGLGPSLGVALLVPFTFGVDPVGAIVALVALYMAAEYGGAITAILINSPGTAAAVATAWDGYPMAQRGEAGKALNISIVSSGIGALIATILLILTAAPLVEFSLMFGPSEYFAMALLGLSLVSAVSGGSLAKGYLAMGLGLLAASIGLDPESGVPRFAASPALFEGVLLVPALLGLYALSEVLVMVERPPAEKRPILESQGILGVPLATHRALLPVTLRSSVIGYVIGVIPGAGAAIASLVAYGDARRISRSPETFGKGNPEGVAAAETANNAAVAGAMAPLLYLGIPGSATAAILVGALMIQGIQPGPLMLSRHPEIVGAISASFLIGIPLMVAIGLLGARLWAKVVLIPPPVLAAVVAGVSLIGAYATENGMFPVYVTLVFGALGYILRKLAVPLAPIVLALVLAPMMETNFRRALVVSGGDWLAFADHPITLVLLGLSALSFVVPLGRRTLSQRTPANAYPERT